MSQEKIESAIRALIEALTKRDVEMTLSCFAEDAECAAPQGTFKGKEELKRYFTWLAQSIPDLMVTDTGIGIMVQGNSAVYEHVIEGTIEGRKWEVLVICVYEFSNEKIQHLRTVYDRLSIAEQVARGWLAKRVISSIVKRTEKGLR